MQVVEGHESVPNSVQGAVLAIGNFDGVHLGHQALISRAKSEAKRTAKAAGVLIFEPHPRVFFRPDEPHFILTSLEEKLSIFREMKLDATIVMTFNQNLAALDAAHFVQTVLVDALKVSHIIIGYDFFFGQNRSGSAETLSQAGRHHGFAVTVIDPVAGDGDAYSSTAIRLNLAEGNVRRAAECLGRPWKVIGKVIGGAKRGSGLGYPTANVPLRPGTSLGHGIYAVRVKLDGQNLTGAAYLGTRPTFDDGAPILEVFLFDFDGDIYGHQIEVEFIEHIRDDRKFETPNALIQQMDLDCTAARKILADPA